MLKYHSVNNYNWSQQSRRDCDKKTLQFFNPSMLLLLINSIAFLPILLAYFDEQVSMISNECWNKFPWRKRKPNFGVVSRNFRYLNSWYYLLLHKLMRNKWFTDFRILESSHRMAWLMSPRIVLLEVGDSIDFLPCRTYNSTPLIDSNWPGFQNFELRIIQQLSVSPELTIVISQVSVLLYAVILPFMRYLPKESDGSQLSCSGFGMKQGIRIISCK